MHLTIYTLHSYTGPARFSVFGNSGSKLRKLTLVREFEGVTRWWEERTRWQLSNERGEEWDCFKVCRRVPKERWGLQTVHTHTSVQHRLHAEGMRSGKLTFLAIDTKKKKQKNARIKKTTHSLKDSST